jgi:hypothetical protein
MFSVSLFHVNVSLFSYFQNNKKDNQIIIDQVKELVFYLNLWKDLHTHLHLVINDHNDLYDQIYKNKFNETFIKRGIPRYMTLSDESVSKINKILSDNNSNPATVSSHVDEKALKETLYWKVLNDFNKTLEKAIETIQKASSQIVLVDYGSIAEYRTTGELSCRDKIKLKDGSQLKRDKYVFFFRDLTEYHLNNSLKECDSVILNSFPLIVSILTSKK